MNRGDFFFGNYDSGAEFYPPVREIGESVPPTVIGDEKESVANEVDSFLDDFLLVAGTAGGGSMCQEGVGSGGTGPSNDFHDMDLVWLQDSNPFLSQTAPSVNDPYIQVDYSNGVSQHLSTEGDEAKEEEGEGGEAGFEGEEEEQEEEEEEAKKGKDEDDEDDVEVSPASHTSNHVSPGRAPSCGHEPLSDREQLRRQKVERYLDKKKRRQWCRAAPYKNRQRVANARPRYKGRFLPMESEFVPIAELRRRQRASLKEEQDHQAASGSAT